MKMISAFRLISSLGLEVTGMTQTKTQAEVNTMANDYTFTI